MNKPTLLPILMLAMMFASSCDSTTRESTTRPTVVEGWTEFGKNMLGDATIYVDLDTIKKGGGYVYYWELRDYLKPFPNGNISVKTYIEVDCGIPRKERGLSNLFYRESMGKGSTSATNTPEAPGWRHPILDSVAKEILEEVCNVADHLP